LRKVLFVLLSKRMREMGKKVCSPIPLPNIPLPNLPFGFLPSHLPCPSAFWLRPAALSCNPSESFIFGKIFDHGFHGWKTGRFLSVPSLKSVVASLWLRLRRAAFFGGRNFVNGAKLFRMAIRITPEVWVFRVFRLFRGLLRFLYWRGF
jgi:hypothetical protein